MGTAVFAGAIPLDHALATADAQGVTVAQALEGGAARLGRFLVDVTRTIKRTFKHVAGQEKETQDPIQTPRLASGSCRDLAVLLIAALRSLGIAARFVSGYLHQADDGNDNVAGGNTPAWVQIHVPGPGWIDLDPSTARSGIITWCASRSCASRVTRSRSRPLGSGPIRTIFP
jgi:transglutaminase-like putative cysteine protease